MVMHRDYSWKRRDVCDSYYFGTDHRLAQRSEFYSCKGMGKVEIFDLLDLCSNPDSPLDDENLLQ